MEEGKKQHVVVHISTFSIVKVLGFLILFWFLYFILDILVVILVATLLATAFNPMVNWMQMKKIPRPLGVILIYACLFALFFGTVALLIPPLTIEIQQITANFPILWERFSDLASGQGQYPLDSQIAESINKGLGSIENILSSSATNAFGFIRNVFGNVISFILIFVLSFYFLVQEDAIKKAFRNFTPPKYKPYLNDLITRMQERVGQWLRGEIILVFVVGILSLIGLKILNVKYFMVLALLSGLLELIPYIGPVVAAIPAVFIAGGESLWKGVAVVILFWLIQQMENHIIVPKVMQKAIGLNPIIIILVILIGARVQGFIGVLIAVPSAAALSVLIKDIFEKDRTRRQERDTTQESLEI